MARIFPGVVYPSIGSGASTMQTQDFFPTCSRWRLIKSYKVRKMPEEDDAFKD
jgi:hypothetical protein